MGQRAMERSRSRHAERRTIDGLGNFWIVIAGHGGKRQFDIRGKFLGVSCGLMQPKRLVVHGLQAKTVDVFRQYFSGFVFAHLATPGGSGMGVQEI
jgi:hypothetical protein